MRFLTQQRSVKLCHARPGDIVMLDPTSSTYYMVCKVDDNPENKRVVGTRKTLQSAGLYNEDSPLFLVNIKTGVARSMKHLSSRAFICHDLAVVNTAALDFPTEESEHDYD